MEVVCGGRIEVSHLGGGNRAKRRRMFRKRGLIGRRLVSDVSAVPFQEKGVRHDAPNAE